MDAHYQNALLACAGLLHVLEQIVRQQLYKDAAQGTMPLSGIPVLAALYVGATALNSAHIVGREAGQDEVARRLVQLARDTLHNLRLAFAVEHEAVPTAFRRAFATEGEGDGQSGP